MSSVLVSSLLAFVGLACTVWLGRARQHYPDADQPALFCALLGVLLPTAAAVCSLVSALFAHPEWQAAQLWLTQASDFLGWPLLGAVALTLSRSWVISRPNWGRLVLGLCVFFELARQLDMLEPYRLLLSLLSVLLLLYAGAMQLPQRRLPLLAAAVGVGLWLLAGPLLERAYGFAWSDSVRQMLLSLAYPLLAWLLLSLPGQNLQKNR